MRGNLISRKKTNGAPSASSLLAQDYPGFPDVGTLTTLTILYPIPLTNPTPTNVPTICLLT